MSKFLHDYWKHGFIRQRELNEPCYRDGLVTIFAPPTFSASFFLLYSSEKSISNYMLIAGLSFLASSQIRPYFNYSYFTQKQKIAREFREHIEESTLEQ